MLQRLDYELRIAGTFANIRLRNLLAPETEGGFTTKDGEVKPIYDAALEYHQEGTPLCVIAGKEYGSGSSRDWAAKGPRLLGVRFVLAESYERIHRSNLVGMGILPLQFPDGESAESLGLTGDESFDLAPLEEGARTLKVSTSEGKEFDARVRIDTPNEWLYYRHDGILHYVLRDLLALSEDRADLAEPGRIALTTDRSINNMMAHDVVDHQRKGDPDQLRGATSAAGGCRGRRVRGQRLPRHEHHHDREARRHLAAVRVRAVSEQARSVPGGERGGQGPDTRRVRRAARGLETSEERLHAMGQAYVELLENREEIMFQHQANAAAGDPELREPIRREFMELFDDVARLSGASEEEVWDFMATGMLLNVIAALDLPEKYMPKGPEDSPPFFSHQTDRSINHARRTHHATQRHLDTRDRLGRPLHGHARQPRGDECSREHPPGPRGEPRAARVDRQRIHAQLRRLPAQRGCSGRPAWEAGGVRGRPRHLHGRLGSRGDGAEHRRADRGARDPGARRRGDHAAVADPPQRRLRGEKRGLALGIWSGVSGLGVALGPVVGGAVVEGFSWHWIFWLNVPIGIALLPVALAVLTESRGPNRTLDVPGVALASSGLLGVVFGIVRAQALGWTSTTVVASIGAGVVLLAAFVAWELRAPAPMVPMRFFRNRAFAATNGVSFAMFFGAFGSIFLLAQFFQAAQGYSPLEAGLRTLPWTAMPIFVARLRASCPTGSAAGR